MDVKFGQSGACFDGRGYRSLCFFENYNVVRVLCRGVAISIFVVERGQKIVWAKKNE